MKARTILLFFFLCEVAVAQVPFVKQWDRRYGGESYEYLTSSQQSTDGGYILGGFSGSDKGGDKTQNYWDEADYWIIKIDSLGNKQWDKRFGGIGGDYLYSLEQTTDGGYILGGHSSSDSTGDKTQHVRQMYYPDYWIVKIDSLGAKLWDKRFGGTDWDVFSCLQQTSDGGYILGGTSSSDANGDKTEPSRGGGSQDYWLVKVDDEGNKLWDRTFGGSGTDNLFSLQQTFDGGYILGGNSYSGMDGDKTQPNWDSTLRTPDGWIVKTDSIGNKQWDKRFGGTQSDRFGDLLQTADGGYLLGGVIDTAQNGDITSPSKGKADFWVVKIDSSGNKEWDKRYGGTYYDDDFSNITTTVDGGYLLAGTSYSSIGGDKSENNLGLEQVWLVKIDALGNRQWDKTIFTLGHEEYGYGFQTKDGCYVALTGTSAGIGGYKTQVNWDTAVVTSLVGDYWIVKFCDTTSNISGIDNLNEDDVVSVFPNPSQNSWQLTVGNNLIGGTAEIFDADGRVVFKSEVRNLPAGQAGQKSEIRLNTERGVYLLRISSAKSSVVRKLIKL